MAANDTYDLLSLLPNSPYTLAYALPLFIVSLILTFAGCFLTLDRTSVFPSSIPSQAIPIATSSFLSRLHLLSLGGGIGGLCAGYAFGVHFSTLLSLALPSTTPTPTLSHKAFLAVWVVSALACLAVAGRWKYAAIAFTCLSGYCTFALAVSVIIHPSLLSRIVFAAVLTPLCTIGCFLPFPHLTRVGVRMAASSLGAFGVTETVALFVRNSAWGNIWQRFWVHDGIAWGTSQEKGLSAAFCFLFVVGLVCDWLLHIKIGENPDEKWDRYLADFTAELPNDVQRAGTFQPILSFWDKLLGRHSSFAPIVQHSGVTGMGDGDVKFPPSASAKLSKQPVSQSQRSPRVPESKLGIARLLKKDARKPHPSRRAIRFRPQDSDSTDSENEMTVGKPAPLRTDSSATLVNPMEASLIHPPNRPWDTRSGEIPDYSDSEVDIGAIGRQSIGDSKPWPPAFFRRHSARAALSPIQLRNKFSSATGSAETQSHLNDEEDTSPHRTTDNSLSTLPLEVASIPATPSLIKAVERIQLAHEVVAHPSFAPSSQTIVPGTPQTEHDQRKSWDTFWDDVKTKAHY